MALIKDKHNTLFKELTTTLLEDLGDTVTIRLDATSTDCEWCSYDSNTGQSSGRPSPGKVWSTHPDYTNDLRCPNCFLGDSLVMTSKGLKEIKDIKKGEKVVAKNGKFEKVVRTFKRTYSGGLVEVEVFPGYTVTCTPDHEFFGLKGFPRDGDTSRNGIYTEIKKGNYLKTEKIKAKNLTDKDFVLLPNLPYLDIELKDEYVRPAKALIKPKEMEDIFKDKDFPIIVGLYIAEGSCSKREVSFSFHEDENLYINFVSRFFTRYGFNVRLDNKKNAKCTVVCIASVRLQKWFSENCGRRSENKRIPLHFLYSNNIKEIIKVISGIWFGDNSDGKRHKGIASVSRNLILELSFLSNKINKKHCVCFSNSHFHKGSGKQSSYTILWNNSGNGSKIIHNSGLKFVNVKSVKAYKHPGTKVYNLEIENDHTYNVNNLVVKNCHGAGVIKTYTTVTLTKSYVEDISGLKFIKGKPGYFPVGTKRIIGLISDVEVSGENYLETANKITIGSDDYTLVSYEKLGIKSDHLFRATVERTEFLED